LASAVPVQPSHAAESLAFFEWMSFSGTTSFPANNAPIGLQKRFQARKI
jgi:hypothetical protein